MDKTAYHISIEKDPESDWLVVQCAEYPAAVSQGKSIDECIKNIQDALDLVLEHKAREKMKQSRMILDVPAALA